jgi:hypothetical protein
MISALIDRYCEKEVSIGLKSGNVLEGILSKYKGDNDYFYITKQYYFKYFVYCGDIEYIREEIR